MKNKILEAIQSQTPLSYETVNRVYLITKSYDAIIDLCQISLKYNKDIIDLAYIFFAKED